MHRVVYFLIYFCLLGSLSGQSTKQGTLVNDWAYLDSLFVEADDLGPVIPVFKELEQKSIDRDSLLTFSVRAITFIREWYEFKFFNESRAAYLQLSRLLEGKSLNHDRLRSDIFFELARSQFFQKNIDSVGYWATKSINILSAKSTYPVNSYNALGIYYSRKGPLKKAPEFYLKAYNSSLSGNKFPANKRIRFLSNLLAFYNEQNEPYEVIRFRTLVEKELKKAQPSVQLALLAQILADNYNLIGTYGQAEKYYNLADEEFLELVRDYDENIGDLSINRGINAKDQGSFTDALAYYDQALNSYNQLEDKPLYKIAYVYSNKGNVYTLQHKYAEAEASHRQSLAINLAEGDSLAAADDFVNIGVNLSEIGNYASAKDYYLKSLNYRRTYPNQALDVANDYINLAEIHLPLNEQRTARLYADSALVIQGKQFSTGRHPQLAYTYLTQARIAQAEGDPEQALTWAQKSLTANHETFAPPTNEDLPPIKGFSKYDYFFEALLLKAQLLAQQAGAVKAELAQSHYARSGDLLDEVKDQLSTREDQITLANYNARLAEAAIGHAYANWTRTQETAWINTAFRYAERAKANVLRSAIAGTAARSSAGIPDSLLQREDELTAAIGYHKRQLAGTPDSTARVYHQRELFTASQSRKKLLATYAQDYPRYAELKRAVPELQLSDLQAVIKPREIIQSYFTGTKKLYVFSIDRKQVSLYELDKPTRLDRDVSGLVKGITRRIDRLYLRKAYELYQLLFPGSETETWRKTVLIPDGPLLKIPFETLLTGPVAATDSLNFGELPYLLGRSSISYAPSASLFYEGRLKPQKEASANDELLAFAPVFSNGQVSASAQRSIGKNALLSALPATRRELESLQSLFTANDRRATTLIGSAATEASLRRSNLRQARYLHFATHGFVNEAYPDLSGLALYPDSIIGKEDNFLSVGEVYNLKLNAELVTLSACETGLGKVADGEGVLGFTRAFLYAGADNLLVSLWQVQDDATAGLMVNFYRRILQESGKGLSANLREAKLRMIKDEQFGHPYYWSPFVLIGE